MMSKISKKDIKYFILAIFPVILSIFISSNIYAFAERKKEELERKNNKILNIVLENNRRIKIETLKKLNDAREQKLEYFRKKIIEAKNNLSKIDNQDVYTNEPKKIISFNPDIIIMKTIPKETTTIKKTRKTRAS